MPKQFKLKSKKVVLDRNETTDLSIQIMDWLWYEYLGINDSVQEYDFHLQDTINDIINEKFGIKGKEYD